MNLVIIRHGETDWNLQERMQGQIDVPLNTRGFEQAERLAERLSAEEHFQFLYTSPMARARATAEVIAQAFHLDPIPDIRLVERSAGELEGKTLPEIARIFPQVYKAWREDKERVAMPGAEDQVKFQERVASFLDMVRSRHPGEEVGVVTHGGTLSMIFATLLGLDIQKRFPFRFDNTSVSKVDFSQRRPRIYLLNDTCHLRTMNYQVPVIATQPAPSLETE